MAEIKELFETSIFDSSCQVLVNTVNCVGVMGRGLALEFKMRFPEMFANYATQCARGLIRPGKLHLFTQSKPWILNFPTKDDWKYPSKIEYLEAGLEKFANTYEERGITSIAFPKLGTTSGKLDWDEVRPLMYHFLEPLPGLQVEIYHFNPKARDNLFNRLLQKTARMNEEDIRRHLGLTRVQANLIFTHLSEGTIKNMIDLQSLRGIGEKAMTNIHQFVNSPGDRIVTEAEMQRSLF